MSVRNISVTIACVLATTVVVAHFFSPRTEESVRIAPDTRFVATTTPPLPASRAVPDGWKEYRNNAFRLSLFYPKELEVKEYLEEGGAITVTFQSVKEQKGFQVFVAPYSEPQVSEERFRQDAPLGVRKNPTNIVVDGATGAAFYSVNFALGDTREVWFIHGGFLYEVTTLRSLDAWLDGIMQTWKFL